MILILIFYNNFTISALGQTYANVGNLGIRTPEDVEIFDNMMFIGNRGSDSISVIDVSNHKLIKQISLSKINEILDPNMTDYEKRVNPSLMAYNPNTKVLYITGGSLIGIKINSNEYVFNNINISEKLFPLNDLKINSKSHLIYATTDNSLIVIDILSHKIINSVPIEAPDKIGFNEVTNKIYVTTKNKVLIIDEQNNYDIVKSITFKQPNALTINKKTNTIYIVNQDANRLAIINGEIDEIKKTLLIGKYVGEETTSDITLNENTNKIYLSNKISNVINVIDGISNQLITTIPIDSPEKIAISEKTNKIYSINLLSAFISIIDTNINKKIFGPNPYDDEAGIKITTKYPKYEKHMDVNEITNKIYVGQGNSLLVIDGHSDRQIKEISLNHSADQIYVDSRSNRIISLDIFTGVISIVDGNTNTILNSFKEQKPIHEIFIDQFHSRVYFLYDNYSISIRDTNTNFSEISKNDFIKNMTKYIKESMGSFYIDDFVIDTNKDLIFILSSDLLFIFDNKMKELDVISVGEYSREILLNPFTSLVYVLNQNSDTISVIDEYTNEVIKNITVGVFPINMNIDMKTNTIYVSNEHSNSISIIDGNTNLVTGTIGVGKFPTSLAINPITQLLYVVNEKSDNISIIDVTKKNVVVGINYELSPSIGGSILCNDHKITNSTIENYIRYPFETKLTCIANPNKGYEFAFWSGNLINDQKNPQIDVKTTQYGTLAANFVKSTAVDFNIPFDTLIQIILIIITAIVGWLIPSIISFINNLRQRPHLIKYVNLINKSEDKISLENIRKEIVDLYAKGKLSNSNYDILNNRISEILENKDQ